MSLKEEVNQDLKESLKEHKELEVSTLRQLLSSVLNKEKEKRFTISQAEPELPSAELIEKSSLNDEEVLELIILEAKKRREAIEGFEKGGRNESAEKERKELEILKKYLPEQMSEEEIEDLVTSVIDQIQAKDIKDMGKVMAALIPKCKGRADNALVCKIVKEVLSG